MYKETIFQRFKIELKRAKDILFCDSSVFNKEIKERKFPDICGEIQIPSKIRVRLIESSFDCYEFRCDKTGYKFSLTLIF